jgi:hypothetical protein
MPAGGAGVGAQGEDGGGDDGSGRGNDFHAVGLGNAGGLGGDVQCLVPPPGVNVGPPQHSQAPAAGTPHAGSAEPLHGVLQQADRQLGFVQEPGGGSYPPQRGLLDGRAEDLAQVREELVSAADRVGAGAYPKSQHVDVNARDLAGGRRALPFQQGESAVDGLAAGWRSGLVGHSGRAPDGVPGQHRQGTRCLFSDGDERRQRGAAPP